MIDSKVSSSRDEPKTRIRSRYRGVAPELLEVIPATPVAGLYDDDVHRRVAVYARVSTSDPRQTSSYELQKNYYEDYVSRHPNWELTKIYADEGISGTSLRHRNSFLEMISDCHAGKIDLIITKSVSRFSRNIMDCIGTVNELKQLTPAIGVLFENEQIFTLNAQSEMSLSFIAAMAQEESHTKSTSMNASYEMRFSHGIFLTPPLLGYDQDENGKLVINPEEAKTVRLIFFAYLYGYSTQQIAALLTDLRLPTKKGNLSWSSNAVLNILQNERHCGAVLARKTFTPNYLDHHSKKNNGERNQYRHATDHEAIVSPEDFVAVQRKICNAKYGGIGIPELHVVTSGALKGFVTVNPRWASFCAEDYRAAAKIFAGELDCEDVFQVNAQTGDPDLRGFEIARSQFFGASDKIYVTFSIKKIKFSMGALRKLNNAEWIELLLQPQKQLLAVRKCDKEARTGIQWAAARGGNVCSKEIHGSAFLPTLFEVLGWDASYRYRINGVRRQKNDEAVLLFDLKETEVLIPIEQLSESSRANGSDSAPLKSSRQGQAVIAYPQSWASTFGSEYYQGQNSAETAPIDSKGLWGITEHGDVYFGDEPQQATPAKTLGESIHRLIGDLRERSGK